MENIIEFIEMFGYTKDILRAKYKNIATPDYKKEIRKEAHNTLNKILFYTLQYSGDTLPKLSDNIKTEIMNCDNIKYNIIAYHNKVLRILKIYYNQLGIIKKLSEIYYEIPRSYSIETYKIF